MTRHSAAFVGVLLALALAIAAPAAAAVRVVAPGGADSGSCPPAAPCASVSYAFAQAAPGDAVELSTGAYGGQTVPATGRSGPPVEVRPAPGADVSLAELTVAGGPVVVRDLRMGSLGINAGDGGATPVRDVSVVGGSAPTVFVQTAIGLTFSGGSYGGNQDGPTLSIAGNPPSRNVLIDRVDFHDATATNSSVHMECIWAGGVQGFTVRNSMFRNCAYFDIFFTTLNGPDPRDVLLESNVFEVTKQSNGQNAPYALNVSDHLARMDNFVIRNNSLGGDIAMQPPVVAGSRIVGNVGPIQSCREGVAYAYNLWTAGKCSGTDVRLSSALSGFVNPGAHDWRLKPGARAIDAGSPTDFPATDRDGKRRVGRADAGAHEFGNPSGLPAVAPRLPAGRGAPRILSVRLTRKRICRRARRGCPSSLRVRVRLDRAATVRVRVQRATGRRRWRTVRTRSKRVASRRGAIRIRARGLRRGRYRVLVRARVRGGPWSATRRLPFRVR